MPRVARQAPGGTVFHVLNRGVGRLRLFENDDDFAAFERVLEQTLEVRPMRVCAYCVMPTHWHLVLWPRDDGDLARFMQWLTITHVRRWVEHRHEVGMGHVYQGRYKSFPVQGDGHFLAVARYVERNALRAGRSNGRVARWSSRKSPRTCVRIAGSTIFPRPPPTCSCPGRNRRSAAAPRWRSSATRREPLTTNLPVAGNRRWLDSTDKPSCRSGLLASCRT